jgi:hypothetical protein
VVCDFSDQLAVVTLIKTVEILLISGSFIQEVLEAALGMHQGVVIVYIQEVSALELAVLT